MAQFIYWNWQDDDSTVNLNHRSLGINDPGAYRGFDVDLSDPGGLTLLLKMDGPTSFDVTKADLSVEKRGVILSKQGVIIQENADLDLPINANPSGSPRIDLVVCEHEYVFAAGASQALYFIIQGTPGGGVPALTFPDKQIIIGQLLMGPTTTALTDAGVIYTPSTVPIFAGDPTIVRTFNDQTITGTKTFNGINLDLENFATYNVGTNFVDLVNNDAFQYLANTDNLYKTVLGFTSFFKGQYMYLNTDQRLKLSVGIGSNVALPFGTGNTMLVERGETLLLINLLDWSLLPPATPFFIVMKVSDANKYLPTKFHQAMKEGKSALTTFCGGSSGATLSLLKDGNYYDIQVNPGGGYIGYIPSFYHQGDAVSVPATEAGTKIQLRFLGNGSHALNLQHNLGSVPANTKPLFMPNAATEAYTTSTIFEFVEDATHWRLVNVISSVFNPTLAAFNITQLQADVATLFANAIKYTKLYAGVSLPAPNASGAGFHTLRTYTLPANTLVNNGDSIKVKTTVRMPRNNNTNVLVVDFGGTQLGAIKDQAGANTDDCLMLFEAELIRVSSTVGKVIAKCTIVDSPTVPPELNDAAATFMTFNEDAPTDTTQTINWTTTQAISTSVQLFAGNANDAYCQDLIVELFRI